MNEKDLTCSIIVEWYNKSNLFRSFLEEVRKTKIAFEIIWPLKFKAHFQSFQLAGTVVEDKCELEPTLQPPSWPLLGSTRFILVKVTQIDYVSRNQLHNTAKFWILAWAGLARGKSVKAKHCWSLKFSYILQCLSPVLVLSIQSKTWSSFLSVLMN